MTIRHNKQFKVSAMGAGFSMIDVLVAIVVLATALLALAALQGAMTRNAADTRARSQIAAYSDGLIDQLRASGFDAIATGTVSPTSGTTSQKAIASAVQTAAGASGLTTTITSTTYYGDTGTFITTAPTSIDNTTPEYKQVNVTTNWTDATGQARTLALDTIVSPVSVDIGNNSLDSQTLTLTAGNTPVVHQYRPDATAGVIPIAYGNGSDTAATNPQPEILGTKTQVLAGVSFNVLTYTAPATVGSATNQVQITQLVDTRVINCHCTYGSGLTDTTNVFTQPYRPTYWNGTQYAQPSATTWKYSNFGADSNYSATEDEFCDICCRDRNDTSGDAMKFNPWNTDYDHWGYTGTTLTKVAAAPSTNGSGTWPTSTGSYVNACRLIRVQGQYSVATDLQNYFFGFLATDNAANAKVPASSTSTNTASSPIPIAAAIVNYQNFITSYLDANLPSSGGSTGTVTSSNFPYDAPGDPTSVVSGTTLTPAASLWAGNSLNTGSIPITYSATTTDYRYLHARGFYIDHLETAAVTAINAAIKNCAATTTSGVEGCVFPFVPFTTINLTQLANWSVDSAGSKVVNVSDTQITGGDPDNPLRGVVNALSTATNNSTGNVTANIGLSNSGITGVTSNYAINTEDQATLGALQQFTLSSGGSSSGGGSIYFTVGLSGLPQIATNVNVSSDPTVIWAGTALLGTTSTGTSSGYQSGSNPNFSVLYEVITNTGTTKKPVYVETPNVLTPTSTGPVGLNVTVQYYNSQTLGSATTGASTTGCTNIVVTQCSVYQVSSVTLKNGVTSASSTLSSSSLAIAPLSSSDTIGINAGKVITIPATNASPAFTGFSSTSSATPDGLTITFAADGTNSYTVAGTCGNCNSGGKKCTYNPGVCTP